MLILDTNTAVNSFCVDTANVWQVIGYAMLVFKVVIPLLLIILGMIDLGKAVVANDDKQIKSSTTSLVKRAVAGIIIFFIPTLVGFIFTIIGGFNDEIRNNYNDCKKCVVSPTSDACKNNASNAWTK